MADVIKVLGQSAPSATTATTLYTVPDGTFTTSSSLMVCNRAATQGTFRVAVRSRGAELENKHYIYYDTPVPANDTKAVIIGMTIQEHDVVTVYASSVSFSFTLFGVETS